MIDARAILFLAHFGLGAAVLDMDSEEIEFAHPIAIKLLEQINKPPEGKNG